MSSWFIWLAAGSAYAAFLAWYQNWRGPLRPAEIEDYLRRLEAAGTGTPGERLTLRAFLEADDGREFLMLNLVRLHDQPIPDPVSGEARPAREIMDRYTRKFLRALGRRGGHPAFLARPAGGFVDTWGLDPGPGWTLVGMMRYRSRRDLADLITDPQFSEAHGFKHAAMPVTCSFPMGRLRLYTGPRVLVGLLLALAAALLS